MVVYGVELPLTGAGVVEDVTIGAGLDTIGVELLTALVAFTKVALFAKPVRVTPVVVVTVAF